MSYCDHFSSVIRPSVHPSVNIFKWLLLWSRWANFAQISYGASLGWGNEKIAKMVTVRWPRWPPCPYMVKTFKNLLLQNRACLMAESLHISSGTGGLPKLLKELSYIDIWPFYGKVNFAFWWLSTQFVCFMTSGRFYAPPPKSGGVLCYTLWNFECPSVSTPTILLHATPTVLGQSFFKLHRRF